MCARSSNLPTHADLHLKPTNTRRVAPTMPARGCSTPFAPHTSRVSFNTGLRRPPLLHGWVKSGWSDGDSGLHPPCLCAAAARPLRGARAGRGRLAPPPTAVPPAAAPRSQGQAAPLAPVHWGEKKSARVCVYVCMRMRAYAYVCVCTRACVCECTRAHVCVRTFG